MSRRIARSALIAVTAGAAILLTGCSLLGDRPSPTSTIEGADGTPVVIDWVDYPAHAGVDGDALLGAPDESDLEPQARAAIALVQAAIEGESGMALHATKPDGEWYDASHWHPQEGNGYGGESMLTTVNCCELESASAPERGRWTEVMDAAGRAAVAAGFGALTPDDTTDPGFRETYCTGADGECWLLSATAFDGYQWLYVTIRDTALDPTGEAAREAEEFGRPPASIAIGYGATVVRSGGADAYADAIRPFVGLERPPGTTSD